MFWFLVTLAIIVSIIALVGFTKWSEKEIKRCIDGGNNEQFCRQEANK